MVKPAMSQSTVQMQYANGKPANVHTGHHQAGGGGGQQRPWSREFCYRCKRQTYFNDKIGPLKDATVFHKGCFKCWICGSRLTLKTYYNNRNDTSDLEIYCVNHAPAAGPHDPIPHRSNLIYSPKTQGQYPQNMLNWWR